MTQGAGVYTTAMARQNRRRKQIVAGVAGLAVVLGGGAYLITSRVTGESSTAPEAGTALPPVVQPSASIEPSPSEVPSVVPSVVPSSSTPKPSASLQQRIDAARSANARLGTQVRPPLPQANVAAVPDKDIKVTNTGTLKSPNGTMRLVTAKGDMTGQRELAWVADEGEQVGDARCTQTFRFSAGMAPTHKPTLLICWRTSPDKSVYTVAVDLDGPKPDDSVALINSEWSKL